LFAFCALLPEFADAGRLVSEGTIAPPPPYGVSSGKEGLLMKRLAYIALCVVALLGLTGCAGNDFYYASEYPEVRFDPGAW
jgi:hypothetical protein